MHRGHATVAAHGAERASWGRPLQAPFPEPPHLHRVGASTGSESVGLRAQRKYGEEAKAFVQLTGSHGNLEAVPHERCGLGGQPACGTSPSSPRDPGTPRFSPAIRWRSHRAAEALAMRPGTLSPGPAGLRPSFLFIPGRRAEHSELCMSCGSPGPARGHFVCSHPSETAHPEEGRLLPGAGRNTQSLTECLLSAHLLVRFPH